MPLFKKKSSDSLNQKCFILVLLILSNLTLLSLVSYNENDTFFKRSIFCLSFILTAENQHVNKQPCLALSSSETIEDSDRAIWRVSQSINIITKK